VCSVDRRLAAASVPADQEAQDPAESGSQLTPTSPSREILWQGCDTNGIAEAMCAVAQNLIPFSKMSVAILRQGLIRFGFRPPMGAILRQGSARPGPHGWSCWRPLQAARSKGKKLAQRRSDRDEITVLERSNARASIHPTGWKSESKNDQNVGLL
jgi:hypothetical protein